MWYQPSFNSAVSTDTVCRIICSHLTFQRKVRRPLLDLGDVCQAWCLPDKLDRFLFVHHGPPVDPLHGRHESFPPQVGGHAFTATRQRFACLEYRSDAEEDGDPFPVIPGDKVHVSSVLNVGVIRIVYERVDAFGRRLEWSSGRLGPVHAFSVSILGTSLGGEEVVPSILLENVTALRYSKGRRFCEHRRVEGLASGKVDLVDERLDARVAVKRWRFEIESRHRLVYTSIVVEQQLPVRAKP